MRGEDILAVEDRPGVVVDRDGINVAVVAGHLSRKPGRVIRFHRGPCIVDRRRQALVGEETHPVTGEPGEYILRGALEVRAYRVLEGAVVDGVDRDLGAAVGGHEVVDERLQTGLRCSVGGVATDRRRAASGGDARRGARAGTASTGSDESSEASVAGDLQHIPSREIEVPVLVDVP